MTQSNPTPEILQLQAELSKVRDASLKATRRGDAFQRAKLDIRARELNNRISAIKYAVISDLPTESF